MIRPLLRLALGLILVLFAAQARAARTSIYLDFDDDNDPWTLRTSLPPGVTSATVRFVLEVHEDFVPYSSFRGDVRSGSCWTAYPFELLCGAQMGQVHFDSLFVEDYSWDGPLGLYEGCPWWFTAQLTPAAGIFFPGQRCFIGQASCEAECVPHGVCGTGYGYLVPPNEFTVSFSGGVQGTSTMRFTCFPPQPVQPSAWRQIKELFR